MIDAYEQYRPNPHSLTDLIQQVLRFGDLVESRYGPCWEILGGRLTIPSGSLVYRKGINYSLGWMEMYQLLAGIFEIDEIKRIAPNADHKLFTPQMAYGPRVADRIPKVLNAIIQAPETRQAVLFIGRPSDGATSNLPCTTTMQFLFRNGILNAIVNMRSWDLCRGLPYDIMMFSGVLEMMGRYLMVDTGYLTVFAGSAHIYEDQKHKIPAMSSSRWEFTNDVPDTHPEAVAFFNKEVYNIQQKELPFGVKVI